MGLVIIGVSSGLLLFLLVAGLTLTFGLLGVVNFAHGAFYMVGAFLAWQVAALNGSFAVSMVSAVLALGILGMFVERWMLRPLVHRPHTDQLLLTFGLLLVLEEGAKLAWGQEYKTVSVPPLLSGWIDIGGSRVSNYRLFVCLIGAALAAVLLIVLERSMLGAAVRACAINPQMSSCIGIDVGKVRLWVFAVGAGLAGLAGVLAAPLLPIDVAMGVSIIIDCFVVIAVGGLGNIKGAVLGSLLLGGVRAVGHQYAAAWVDIFTYSLLVGVLMFRPEGLFGRKARKA